MEFSVRGSVFLYQTMLGVGFPAATQARVTDAPCAAVTLLGCEVNCGADAGV